MTEFQPGQKFLAPKSISNTGYVEIVAVNNTPNPPWQLQVKTPGGLPFLITKAILLAWQRQ